MSSDIVICFDLDGPILDVSERYYRIYADLVTAWGRAPMPADTYWQAKRRRVPDRDILAVSGLGDWTEDYQRCRRDLIEQPRYLGFDRLQPGLLDLLDGLTAHHVVLLVTLRNHRAGLLTELEGFSIFRKFTAVLSASGDGPLPKPEVKRRLVIEALGGVPSAGWFIGDTETDLRAGQSLGLATVAVTYGIRTEDLLTPLHPTRLCRTATDLNSWAAGLLDPRLPTAGLPIGREEPNHADHP